MTSAGQWLAARARRAVRSPLAWAILAVALAALAFGTAIAMDLYASTALPMRANNR